MEYSQESIVEDLSEAEDSIFDSRNNRSGSIGDLEDISSTIPKIADKKDYSNAINQPPKVPHYSSFSTPTPALNVGHNYSFSTSTTPRQSYSANTHQASSETAPKNDVDSGYRPFSAPHNNIPNVEQIPESNNEMPFENDVRKTQNYRPFSQSDGPTSSKMDTNASLGASNTANTFRDFHSIIQSPVVQPQPVEVPYYTVMTQAQAQAQAQALQAIMKAQAEQEQAAKEKTARDQAEILHAIMKAQAAKEQAAKEQAEREQAEAVHAIMRAQAAQEQAAKEQAEREQAEAVHAIMRAQAAQEQAEKERAEREQAEALHAIMRAQAAQEQAEKEKAEREQAEALHAIMKAQAAQEQAEKEKAEREQAEALHAIMKAQAAQEQAAKEKAEREQAEALHAIMKAQAAKEQAAKEQAAKEQAEALHAIIRAQAAQEQAAKEQAAKEQAERELAEKSLLEKDQNGVQQGAIKIQAVNEKIEKEQVPDQLQDQAQVHVVQAVLKAQAAQAKAQAQAILQAKVAQLQEQAQAQAIQAILKAQATQAQIDFKSQTGSVSNYSRTFNSDPSQASSNPNSNGQNSMNTYSEKATALVKYESVVPYDVDNFSQTAGMNENSRKKDMQSTKRNNEIGQLDNGKRLKNSSQEDNQEHEIRANNNNSENKNNGQQIFAKDNSRGAPHIAFSNILANNDSNRIYGNTATNNIQNAEIGNNHNQKLDINYSVFNQNTESPVQAFKERSSQFSYQAENGNIEKNQDIPRRGSLASAQQNNDLLRNFTQIPNGNGNGNKQITMEAKNQSYSEPPTLDQVKNNLILDPEISDTISSPKKVFASGKQSRRKKREKNQISAVNVPDNVPNDRLSSYNNNSALYKFASASTVSSRHVEKDRLTSIHNLGILENKDNSRLSKITNLTNRLLNGAACVISIVDLDRVIWVSSHFSTPPKSIIKDEQRYESFCSWVVQDETGRGVIVMDSKADPRCTHMRIKSGFEFYAGAPLITSDGIKIGALSIRGPTRAQFSIMDMNLLHEMASWTMSEIEMVAQRKEIELREVMQISRAKIGKLMENEKIIERGEGMILIENTLSLIREGLRASTVLFMKIVPETDHFKSVVGALSTSTSSPCTLTVSSEAFLEIGRETLNLGEKSTCLILDPLPIPIQKEVDQVLSKKILRCVSQLIWSFGLPVGFIIVFVEGSYRSISMQDGQFLAASANALSNTCSKMDTMDAFKQAQTLSKSVISALRKHPTLIGNIQGLSPCILILEPVFTNNGENNSVNQSEATKSIEIGARGEAQAKLIADSNLIEEVIGAERGKEIRPAKELEKQLEAISLSPEETVKIISDFTQMLDVLADRYNIKRPKKFGNLFFALSNIGPDSGTAENLASFAHELFFSLDVYMQKTRRKFGARVGIHSEIIPVDTSDDSEISGNVRDIWAGMINTAYKLENQSEHILVSDGFYNITKGRCTYDNGNNVYIRGQGSITTYRLIGTSTAEKNDASNEVDVASPEVKKVNSAGLEEGEIQVKSRKKHKCAPQTNDFKTQNPNLNPNTNNISLGNFVRPLQPTLENQNVGIYQQFPLEMMTELHNISSKTSNSWSKEFNNYSKPLNSHESLQNVYNHVAVRPTNLPFIPAPIPTLNYNPSWNAQSQINNISQITESSWDKEFQNIYQKSNPNNLESDGKWEKAFEQYVSQDPDFDDNWLESFESAWKNANVDSSEDYDFSGLAPSPAIVDPDPVTAPLSDYIFEQLNPFLNLDNPMLDGLRILSENGSLSEAALAFEAAVQKDPRNSEAWMQLGIVQAENEKEAPAIAALQRCVKEDNLNSRALLALSVSYTNEGMDLHAYTTLKRWLSVNYPSIAAQKNTHSDLLSEVTSLFLNAARQGPSAKYMSKSGDATIDADVQVGLGVLFYNSGEYEKAIDCFTSALSVNPNDYRLWSRLGATLANSGKSEEAIEAYYKALAIKPSFVRGRYNLGVSCINIGCYKEAAEHFLGALNLHNTESKAHISNNLWDTLRRTFILMERKDLGELIHDRDISLFKSHFNF